MERVHRAAIKRHNHVRHNLKGKLKERGVCTRITACWAWKGPAWVRLVPGSEEAVLMAHGEHGTRDTGFHSNFKISKESWVCQTSECVYVCPEEVTHGLLLPLLKNQG